MVRDRYAPLQLKRTALTGILTGGPGNMTDAPSESIGGKSGISYMYGAIICSGLFILIAGVFAKLKLFPAVVTGS